MDKLSGLDSEILDSLLEEDCDPEDYQSEHNSIEEYRDQWMLIKVLAEEKSTSSSGR